MDDVLCQLRGVGIATKLRIDSLVWHGIRRHWWDDMGLARGYDRHSSGRLFDG